MEIVTEPGTLIPLTLLDLPQTALKAIVTALPSEDRRCLALVCKALLSVVRSQWTVVFFDPLDPPNPSDGQPPEGIAHFTGVTTVVWAPDAAAASIALGEDPWETTDRDVFVPQDVDEFFGDSSMICTKARVTVLHKLLWSATDAGTRPLRLVRAEGSYALKASTFYDLLSAGGKWRPWYTSVDAGWFIPDLLDGSVESHGSYFFGRMGCAANPLGEDPWPQPPPLISRGSVGLLEPENPFVNEFVWMNYSSLTSLRFFVAEYREFWLQDLSHQFAEAAESLCCEATLPLLRELHLGTPLDAAPIRFDPRLIHLPQLTKLVLNEMMVVPSFSSFGHLSSLHTLHVATSCHVEPSSLADLGIHEYQAPQDLEALSTLQSLRSLKIEFWRVQQPQNVAVLTQLTELHLESLSGRVNYVRPSIPMPALKGVTLTAAPRRQDMRFIEDSKFARRLVQQAPVVFPSCEVLHIGTVGSAPAQVASRKDLEGALEFVDELVMPLLEEYSSRKDSYEVGTIGSAAGGHDEQLFRYLQLDTVLNFVNHRLEDKCTDGTVQVDHIIKVNDVSWERSVGFVLCPEAEVQVAEFHYSRL